ncbi:LADA_0G16600g1_1 [Lachancea dasiensis]|uniref:LADA_0G16600g1_1 n=1 Tax=Lachancea dasiensis TaxID=1072105 RepID=A0A1G4JX11_9SACH|nr:LADA_0G16600g1_1 [Lachancea dasiensis]
MVETSFGHEFRKRYFTLLDPSVIPLNHGSFGTTPTCVIEKQSEISHRHEWYPDHFETFEAEDLYKEQILALGRYIGVDAKNLALVTNATTGVNTVIRSIKWDFSNDKVLLHSTCYQACKNTIKFMAEYYGLRYDVIELNYPLEDNDVLSEFDKRLATGEYRLCMFDMISSMPGLKLPYQELIVLCQKYATLSLLDGAHAAGLVNLSFLNELKPDFMTTNLHKWLSVPKPCGLLYVHEKHHGMIQTCPISWNYSLEACQHIENPKNEQEIQHNEQLLHKKFWFVGTASYSQYFCIKEAIKFRQQICGGEERIHAYQRSLQIQAIKVIKDTFGTGSELLQNEGMTLVTPGMFNLSLPLPEKYECISKKLQQDAFYFRKVKLTCDRIAMERKSYVPFFFHSKKLWFRFSVQIFNEIEDYVRGAQILKAIIFETFDKELSLTV